MRVKGKRVLKNGVTAGYVKQEDGSWKWRFLSGPKKSKKRGGVKINNNIKPGRPVISSLPNPRANAPANTRRAVLSNEEARNKEKDIVNFIKTANNALEDIFDPAQIPSIIIAINDMLISDIPKLTAYAISRANELGGNAEQLAEQLRELRKKAEKRIKLLQNKNEKNSELNQMKIIFNELGKSLHNSPKGSNYAMSLLPTAISGRKQTMPNLDSGLSINKLKNFLHYLKENPSVFKSQNKDERKMITDNIKSLISKKYQYYYIKFITNPKLQRLLKNPYFLRTSPEESEKEIIKEIEENGGNALFYIKQVNSPNLYSSILKYFMRKFIEKDLDPYLIAQFTNIQGKLPNLIPKDAYAEIIITKNNSNRNANAMPNWMQNNNQLLESGTEIYRMRVEGRFFGQLMNNLIIPMLRFKNQTNIKYVDEKDIAVLLVPNIFGMSDKKIGDISLEGLDNMKKMTRIRELRDIINNLFVTLINNYLRAHNIVIDTNHPHNANNGQGGASKGGSKKRRKRRTTKKKENK